MFLSWCQCGQPPNKVSNLMYIDDIDADVYLQHSEPITSAGSLTGESVAIGTSPQLRSHAQNQMIISLSLLCISSTTN